MATKKNTKRLYLLSRKGLIKLFTFTQESEGSIYCWIRNQKNSKWIIPDMQSEEPKLILADHPSSEKISIHRSGVGKIEVFTAPRINGVNLSNLNKDELFPRHIFSVCPSDPGEKEQANFVDLDSITGQVIRSDLPFAVNFFAIPKLNIELKLIWNFRTQSTLADTQYGSFPLKYHVIFWLSYRTNDINVFPADNLFFSTDGTLIPFFTGIQDSYKFSTELRPGIFRYEEPVLNIDC